MPWDLTAELERMDRALAESRAYVAEQRKRMAEADRRHDAEMARLDVW